MLLSPWEWCCCVKPLPPNWTSARGKVRSHPTIAPAPITNERVSYVCVCVCVSYVCCRYCSGDAVLQLAVVGLQSQVPRIPVQVEAVSRTSCFRSSDVRLADNVSQPLQLPHELKVDEEPPFLRAVATAAASHLRWRRWDRWPLTLKSLQKHATTTCLKRDSIQPPLWLYCATSLFFPVCWKMFDFFYLYMWLKWSPNDLSLKFGKCGIYSPSGPRMHKTKSVGWSASAPGHFSSCRNGVAMRAQIKPIVLITEATNASALLFFAVPGYIYEIQIKEKPIPGV